MLGLGGARANMRVVYWRLLGLGNRWSGSYHCWRLWNRIGGRNNGGWASYDGLLLLLLGSSLRLLDYCLTRLYSVSRLRLGRSCLGCLIID